MPVTSGFVQLGLDVETIISSKKPGSSSGRRNSNFQPSAIPVRYLQNSLLSLITTGKPGPKKVTINAIYFLLILSVTMTTETVKAQTLQTVPNVDLNKYAGKWFEIASYPQRFQKGCHCTSAQYTLSSKGYVIVENRCNRGSVNGKQSYIKGKAFVTKNSGNAKLKVQFFWPFRGKYWIIDLADDYSYAVVSHPNKKYLWILSRTPRMDDSVYQQIITRLKEKGFDMEKLRVTEQCY